MTKSYQICCPKCNNHQNFYRYGKDKDGNQKYLCRVCGHQFVPDANATGKSGRPRIRSYPICPICGKAMFLHHEHKYYSNYQCGDKKCGHSLFVPKQAAITASAMSKLSGKTNFKLMPTLNFDSDEWHANETVVKIRGMKYYLWLVVDSETRFVLGFHLSKYRDSPQAFSLLNSIKHLGKPRAVVTDRYSAYKIPVKTVLNVKHIRVHSFSDDITNNLIECFNKRFKAWYKTKQGFSSFNSANNLIAVFLFFYNFVRPHSALNSLTPAQVAGLNLSARSKHKLLFVA